MGAVDILDGTFPVMSCKPRKIQRVLALSCEVTGSRKRGTARSSTSEIVDYVRFSALSTKLYISSIASNKRHQPSNHNLEVKDFPPHVHVRLRSTTIKMQMSLVRISCTSVLYTGRVISGILCFHHGRIKDELR
jgi:hypothetical protein